VSSDRGEAGNRRRAIRSLIQERKVVSQAELVDQLRQQGYVVTQATVSRDLAAIGARKLGSQYKLNGAVAGASGLLAQVIGDFVQSIAASGNLVVMKTPPGAAQVVAAAVDAAGLQGVLGTVAGDDTVLVVGSEQTSGRGLKHKLEEIGSAR
jgi:transcriptional regulator of arginine metabolism